MSRDDRAPHHLSRRHAIAASAAALAAAASRSAWPASTGHSRRTGTLLILGGTGFLGPHLTDMALERGWRVSHFNRGRHPTGGNPRVETLIGDRKGQLEALRGRRWDAVIDNTGYVPKYVRESAKLLAPEVGFYLFVSSIAVYASLAVPDAEDAPTSVLTNPDEEVMTARSYGPMRALCERYCREVFENRLCIVRPGYIVGPLDEIDGFTHWPVRASEGGEMLAPGAPQDQIQIIDVRDLASWMLDLVERKHVGVYNAISPPHTLTIGDVLRTSVAASPEAATRVTWVPEDHLPPKWLQERRYLIPWRSRSGEWTGEGLMPTDRAVRAGLRLRPLSDTVRDTLAWYRTLTPEQTARPRFAIDPGEEAAVIAALRASRSGA